MAATWTITSTQYDIKGSKGDNQITTLHWECTDKDGDHSGRVYGSTAIPEPSGTFIEYAKVTHENCVTWCKAIMGDEQVKAYEDSVQNQINLSKTPTQGSGKPW
jgi:cobalamin biosynthesis Mg chelatase CobN